MKRLLPTDAQIKSVSGDLRNISGGPRSYTPKPRETSPSRDGRTPKCYEESFGTPDALTDRMFLMLYKSDSGTSFSWALNQLNSPDDIKARLEKSKKVANACGYEFFDAGTSSGLSFATRKSAPMKDTSKRAFSVVTSGDVEIIFQVTGLPLEEAKTMARKMAPVMEKRLKASATRG